MVNRLLEEMRKRIVSWALWSYNRHGKPPELVMRSCWDNIKSCLVFWPGEGLDIIAAEIVLNRLRERFPLATLTVLAMPGVGASPPSNVSVRVIQIDRKMFNFTGLPIRILKDELLDLRADMAVDLSPEFNVMSAYLCRISRARICISFADSKGDLVYNYQVAPGPQREGLDRYRALARYIG